MIRNTTAVAEAPGRSLDALRRRQSEELSFRIRLLFAAVLFGALATAGVTGALLVGEDGLPTRTKLAFATIVVAGLAWAGLSVWVLARRRVLFSAQRIATAWLAVVLSAVFLGGALGAPWFLHQRPSGSAGALGAVMLAVAIGVLIQAKRRHRALRRRRADIEARLAAGGR